MEEGQDEYIGKAGTRLARRASMIIDKESSDCPGASALKTRIYKDRSSDLCALIYVPHYNKARSLHGAISFGG